MSLKERELSSPPSDESPDGADERSRRLEIVIPVYNEEAQLEPCISQLVSFLSKSGLPPWSIVIADNASIDRTWAVATSLEKRVPGVRAVHLDQKGRGRALNLTWSGSTADVVCYMDVDLSTGLEALPALVLPLIRGEADLSIGSRHIRGSQITRGWKRDIISRTYNRIIRTSFRVGFVDAQCGFKAITRAAVRDLLPDVADTTWFFDTELLLLATYRGYRILEVPVRWIEDCDSRVALPKTMMDDLRGLWRMRFVVGEERAKRTRTPEEGLTGSQPRPTVDAHR